MIIIVKWWKMEDLCQTTCKFYQILWGQIRARKECQVFQEVNRELDKHKQQTLASEIEVLLEIWANILELKARPLIIKILMEIWEEVLKNLVIICQHQALVNNTRVLKQAIWAFTDTTLRFRWWRPINWIKINSNKNKFSNKIEKLTVEINFLKSNRSIDLNINRI